jgi:hypothetical protein
MKSACIPITSSGAGRELSRAQEYCLYRTELENAGKAIFPVKKHVFLTRAVCTWHSKNSIALFMIISIPVLDVCSLPAVALCECHSMRYTGWLTKFEDRELSLFHWLDDFQDGIPGIHVYSSIG